MDTMGWKDSPPEDMYNVHYSLVSYSLVSYAQKLAKRCKSGYKSITGFNLLFIPFWSKNVQKCKNNLWGNMPKWPRPFWAWENFEIFNFSPYSQYRYQNRVFEVAESIPGVGFCLRWKFFDLLRPRPHFFPSGLLF